VHAHNTLTALEVVSAWCALEVFLVSIVVALLQIEQVAKMLVGANCDALGVVYVHSDLRRAHVRTLHTYIVHIADLAVQLQYLPPTQVCVVYVHMI
jgi:uncharacterized paraquat-inducible protein A